MKHFIKPLLLSLSLAIGTTHAIDDGQIRSTLAKAGLTANIASTQPSPIDSLTLIQLDGDQEPLLITDDLAYIIQGNIEANPSPAVAIDHISTGKAGTPIDAAHKAALLANMTALKNIDDTAAFYHTNVKGVLWAVSASSAPFLLSDDGRYFINGEISVVKDGQFAGLDGDFEHTKNRHVLSQLDDDTLAIYPAQNQKAVIYVATDINCPYCKVFHNKINELNSKGITVKAIGYPVYDESHTPMRELWCEQNPTKRAALLSAAMKGIVSNAAICTGDSPITHNQILAHSLAIFATPAIFNEQGKLFEGDLKGDDLLEFLNIK